MKNSARRLLAKRVRALRRRRGWSQSDLAAAARLRDTYIGALELAERRVGIDEVEKIAKALKVRIAELFRADD